MKLACNEDPHQAAPQNTWNVKTRLLYSWNSHVWVCIFSLNSTKCKSINYMEQQPWNVDSHQAATNECQLKWLRFCFATDSCFRSLYVPSFLWAVEKVFTTTSFLLACPFLIDVAFVPFCPLLADMFVYLLHRLV